MGVERKFKKTLNFPVLQKHPENRKNLCPGKETASFTYQSKTYEFKLDLLISNKFFKLINLKSKRVIRSSQC